jgi:FMN phosphatase YigB (HAD superfamily)
MGVGKPEPAFFARALEMMGSPAAASVAYVGDRVDNDVIPAAAAGMRAVWIRRGPWGVIQDAPDGVAALVVDSLDELVKRIGEGWS